MNHPQSPANGPFMQSFADLWGLPIFSLRQSVASTEWRATFYALYRAELFLVVLLKETKLHFSEILVAYLYNLMSSLMS